MRQNRLECRRRVGRCAVWMPALVAILLSSAPAWPEAIAERTGRDLRELQIGSPETLALGEVEVHAYGIDLQAGELVKLVLERHGVALLVKVYDADGERLSSFGSSIDRQGPLPVEFVAPTAGTFRVEVRALGQPTPPGTYDLTLEQLRPAASEDQSRQAAESCRKERWLDDQGEFLVNAALDSIARCAVAVGRKLEGDRPGAGAIAGDLQKEVDFLNERWRWGEFVSAEYAASLEAGFDALAVAATRLDAATALEVLREVAADIEIKADHCRNSSRGLGGDVTVVVTTQKEDRGDPGWQVYYKPRIFEFLEGYEAERFPRPTDPSTSGELAPGKYLLWAQRPGEDDAAGKPDVLSVGGGKPRMEWVLMVFPIPEP